MRVKRLEVGVRVDAAVSWVGEAVQALAGARIGALRGHPQFVLVRQAGQGYPVAVECRGIDRLRH